MKTNRKTMGSGLRRSKRRKYKIDTHNQNDRRLITARSNKRHKWPSTVLKL